MKQVRFAVVCWVVAIGTVASAQLTLRLESDVTGKLPGLPIPLRLVAGNAGSTQVRLPAFVYVHASAEGHESFVAVETTPWRKAGVTDEGEDPLPTLAPGATVTGELPVSTWCEGPYSLMHPFVFPARRYTLRALAAPDPHPLAEAFERNSTLQETMSAVAGLTVSSPLVIEVREPQGVDAEAWSYILAATSGSGWSRMYGRNPTAITRQLRERFPASQYTYCFGAAFLEQETTPAIEAFAARLRAASPRPPSLDRVEFTLAGRHDARCTQHYLADPPAVDAAIAECDAARTLYQQLLERSQDAGIRTKAAEAVSRVMSGEEIRNFVLRHAAVQAGTYQKLVPVLQCVKETGARLEARFGYRNPNPFPVYHPAGAGNLFTPAPEDRGQPTKFLPGVHEGVVTVEVEGRRTDAARVVSWTLDGTTVSAPLATAPRCKGK